MSASRRYPLELLREVICHKYNDYFYYLTHDSIF